MSSRMSLLRTIALLSLGTLACTKDARPGRSDAPAPRHAAPLPTKVAPAPAVDVLRATDAASTALDRSYADFAKVPGRIAPPHAGPWVTAAQAEVTGDAQHGLTFHWAMYPPAGFEYDAKVVIDSSGKLEVKSASATFSPK
jgi:hypothetical protein